MLAPAQTTPEPGKDYACCNGCGLCLLVCPVWRRSRDIALTPFARAKALQFGATAADIEASVQSCALCAACEPVCPEDIGLVAMTLGLRSELPRPAAVRDLQMRLNQGAAAPAAPVISVATALLPGPALRARPAALARALQLLGGESQVAAAADDGADIALALEAGLPIPAERRDRFLHALRRCARIIVADGLLARELRRSLPQANIESLGAALSSIAAVRRALRASDLYVIEPRAYHADYQRLVRHYDELRASAGCAFNLDLQRIAIPVRARSLPQRLGIEPVDDGAQLRWILQGHKVTRVVVEDIDDSAAFAQVTGLPVVYLAELADDGA